MPSIPQSLLWISLVVLWLFVLVPMLINKRDTVRRTSDVALSTRVLNRGAAARLLKRGGPAAGHRSDPDWRPKENDYDDLDDLDDDLDDLDEDEDEAPRSRAVVVSAAASVEETGPDYLDVEVVDEGRGALPAGRNTARADEDEIPEGDDADQYEYVDDTSGIAVGE
jgi:hypothetical protein